MKYYLYDKDTGTHFLVADAQSYMGDHLLMCDGGRLYLADSVELTLKKSERQNLREAAREEGDKNAS